MTPDEGDTQTSGFTEEERKELRDLIAEAVGSVKPPDTPAEPTGPKKVTDAEWDNMSDRSRESWVRQLVDSELDRLAREDQISRHDAEIEKLKADKTPEPEAPPSVVTKIQKFLWGEPEKK
jgi:hypothetical protein